MDGMFVDMHWLNVVLIVIRVVKLMMGVMVAMVLSLEVMSGFFVIRLMGMFMLVRGNFSSVLRGAVLMRIVGMARLVRWSVVVCTSANMLIILFAVLVLSTYNCDDCAVNKGSHKLLFY